MLWLPLRSASATRSAMTSYDSERAANAVDHVTTMIEIYLTMLDL